MYMYQLYFTLCLHVLFIVSASGIVIRDLSLDRQSCSFMMIISNFSRAQGEGSVVGSTKKNEEDLQEEARDVSHAPDLLGGPSLSSKGERDVYK